MISLRSKVPLPTPDGPHTTTGRDFCCCSSAVTRELSELRVAGGPPAISAAETVRLKKKGAATRPEAKPKAPRAKRADLITQAMRLLRRLGHGTLGAVDAARS